MLAFSSRGELQLCNGGPHQSAFPELAIGIASRGITFLSARHKVKKVFNKINFRLQVIYACKHLVRRCIDNLVQSYTRRYSHHH
jgi:hypothetical protein